MAENDEFLSEGLVAMAAFRNLAASVLGNGATTGTWCAEFLEARAARASELACALAADLEKSGVTGTVSIRKISFSYSPERSRDDRNGRYALRASAYVSTIGRDCILEKEWDEHSFDPRGAAMEVVRWLVFCDAKHSRGIPSPAAAAIVESHAIYSHAAGSPSGDDGKPGSPAGRKPRSI